MASGDPSCPVSVPGTSVNVEDTDTGAALVFVTTGDVAELRKRVSAMAQMHNEHHGAMGALPGEAGGTAGQGHDMGGTGSSTHAGHDMSKMGGGSGHESHDMGAMGSGEHAGHDMSTMGGGEHAGHAGAMIGVHSKATAEEVPNGAKLVLIVSGSDVAKLQGELRMHAQHFSAGTCQMGSH